MTITDKCIHIRGECLVPGWGCCRCRCYNGYQREQCRNCGHIPDYPTDGTLGEEAVRFRVAGSDREKIIALMEGIVK